MNDNTIDQGTLRQVIAAETDLQISTAKMYPRNVQHALQAMHDYLDMSDELAGACNYTLKRKNRSNEIVLIEGPSIRFMEMLSQCWGNCRVGARPMAEERNFVTAQGVFHDLERNVQITREVRRPIVSRKGKRYGQDMISVTTQAACSIAYRNAVAAGIPQPLWDPLYQKARKLSVGSGDFGDRRDRMLKFFSEEFAIDEAGALKILGLAELGHIRPAHLPTMRGIVQSLRDGQTSVDELLGQDTPSETDKGPGEAEKPPESTSGADRAKDLARKAGAKASDKAPEKSTERQPKPEGEPPTSNCPEDGCGLQASEPPDWTGKAWRYSCGKGHAWSVEPVEAAE